MLFACFANNPIFKIKKFKILQAEKVHSPTTQHQIQFETVTQSPLITHLYFLSPLVTPANPHHPLSSTYIFCHLSSPLPTPIILCHPFILSITSHHPCQPLSFFVTPNTLCHLSSPLPTLNILSHPLILLVISRHTCQGGFKTQTTQNLFK